MTAKPIRLLEIVATADPASGGPIEGILRQESWLVDAGIDRHVVTCDPLGAAYLDHLSLKVLPMGHPSRPLDRGRILRFGYTSRLVPWIRDNLSSFDAVIVDGLWNYASVAASLTLPNAGVPYFLYSHGMMDPWFRKSSPLKHFLKQASWCAFEGRLARHARAVLFTTDEEMRLADGQFWGHPYHGEVVGYGTSPPPLPTSAQESAFHAAVPSLGRNPYILFLSRIHVKKGCDLLLHAYARCVAELGNVQLVIAGPDRDGLQSELAAQARNLGIEDRVHWPGMLEGDAKWGALRGASAFILPSHQENFGIAVVEALACGIPVLTTDKVNIWREVLAGGAGLISSDTVEGIESLLSRFNSMSAEGSLRMGAAGKDVFEAHFDVKTTVQTLIGLIREAAEK